MQCIIMENILIKFTHHDETKKRAHDSQIVRAKENLKLSHVGLSIFSTIVFLLSNVLINIQEYANCTKYCVFYNKLLVKMRTCIL